MSSTHRARVRKWSRALERELDKRSLRKSRARQIANEQQEIECLKTRVAVCFRWLREAASGCEGAPLVSDEAAEAALRVQLATLKGDLALPPLAEWYARVVLWVSGTHALKRYLQSLSPVLRPRAEIAHVELLRRFHEQLHIWKQRGEKENHRLLRSELRGRMAQLPAEIVLAGKFSARLRGVTFVEHCAKLIDRCQKLLATYQELPLRRIPAVLAALAACDGGQAPLPRRLVKECLDKSDWSEFQRTATILIEQSEEPGYDRLLAAMEALDRLPSFHQLDIARQQLAGEASIDDLAWAIDKNFLDCFDNSFVSLAWARRVWEDFHHLGLALDYDELDKLQTSIANRADQKLLDAILRWLKRPARRSYTPKILHQVRSSVLELILPGMKLRCHGKLHAVTQVAGGAGPRLQQCLDGIAYYQRLAGVAPAIPKSIRKLLDKLDRDRREQRYLQAEAARGQISPAQQDRLDYLKCRATLDAGVNARRVERAAEEYLWIAAFDALRSILRRSARATLQHEAGISLGDAPVGRLIAWAQWVAEMNDTHRQILRQVVDGWQRHGAGYKACLDANQTWLAKAKGRGVMVNEWLRAESSMTYVDGRPATICCADDPLEVFMMGSYFGTCLSLGQCNQHSVVANAHDANKQVIFMYDGNGKPLVRQLVAISEDFELLGYYCYTCIDHRQVQRRDRYIAAMAEFCGRLAHRCGIKLSGGGQPESLGEHFWYDDGAWAWHQAATDAWKLEEQKRCAPVSLDHSMDAGASVVTF